MSNSESVSSPAHVRIRTGRLKLLFLALIFIGPLATSAFLYYGLGWHPQGQINHGQLLSPILPLPALALTDVRGVPSAEPLFRSQWTLLYVGSARCDAACQKALYNARQVHTALGKEAHRVKGIYVATDRDDLTALQALMAREHQGLALWFVHGDDRAELAAFLQQGGAPADSDAIYVIDPLGNWVLYYTPDHPPKGWLKDLKKLLRLSRIG